MATNVFCDTDVVDEQRAPTVEDFFVLFDPVIEDLDLVTNITITAVNEAEDTQAPVTTAPTTVAPIAAAPVTTAPVTAAPSNLPSNGELPSAAPSSVTTTFEAGAKYEVAFRGGEMGSSTSDLVLALDELAVQVLAEIFPDASRRRRLSSVSVQLPSSLKALIETGKSTSYELVSHSIVSAEISY